MNKILKVMILIILCVFFTGCNKEEQETMPEIVFMYSSNYNGERVKLYLYDNQGNIYFSNERDVYYCQYINLVEQYTSGSLKDKITLVATIDTEELQEKYDLLKEIMSTGEYEIVSMDYWLNIEVAREEWTGIYYDTKGNTEIVTLYEEDEGYHKCSDERAYEIIEWINAIIEE